MPEKEYIEREAAIKALIESPSKIAAFTAKVITAIENLPTADVAEVKHGEWVNPSNNPEYVNKECFSDCSICGFTTSEESHFCPNCGAKMDGKGG